VKETISITGGFAFRHSAETCLHVVYNMWHLKG